MSTPSPIPPEPREVAAAALNEQGYLLQQRLLEEIETPSPGRQFNHRWYFDMSEFPVALPDGSQTRIDIVLRHSKASQPTQWRAVIESKRANPNYKQ